MLFILILCLVALTLLVVKAVPEIRKLEVFSKASADKDTVSGILITSSEDTALSQEDVTSKNEVASKEETSSENQASSQEGVGSESVASKVEEEKDIVAENTTSKNEGTETTSKKTESSNNSSTFVPSEAASSSQVSSSVADKTTSKESTSNTTTSSNTTPSVGKHPISGLPFKMLADPLRGISWDGVSSIIYTYPDGSTGTEPYVGATYERSHFEIATYEIYYDDFGRATGSICSDCGKKVGNEPNEVTCYKTSHKEYDLYCPYCPYCAVKIDFSVCHTCEKSAYKGPNYYYCNNCGHPLRDKHYRFIKDMNCPDCGEWLKKMTCHICN